MQPHNLLFVLCTLLLFLGGSLGSNVREGGKVSIWARALAAQSAPLDGGAMSREGTNTSVAESTENAMASPGAAKPSQTSRVMKAVTNDVAAWQECMCKSLRPASHKMRTDSHAHT